jgi:hypothetical protein
MKRRRRNLKKERKEEKNRMKKGIGKEKGEK